MTHSLYTHNILVKNPNELVKNGKIIVKDGYIDSISRHEVENTSNDPEEFYIITPGFINLHCHLAYSDIELESQGLFPWIDALMDKCLDNPFDAKASSYSGALEALKTGTTFLVDNTNYHSAGLEALNKTGLRGIVAKELFGSDPDLAELIVKNVFQDIEAFAFSPHSLYSVSPEIWGAIYGFVDGGFVESKFGKLIFSHFAEDIEEEEWFRDKNSSNIKNLESFWSRINVLKDKKKFWRGADSSWDYFKKYILKGFLKSDFKAVLTHAINLSETEIEEIAKYDQIRLVTCPRSNEFLKHNIASVDLWEKHGILYGLGTDSKSSNYDLDLRKEAVALKENFKKLVTDISYKRLFEIMTIDAARVLDLEQEMGSLDEGKLAEYCVWKVTDKNLNSETLLEGDSEEIFSLLINSKKLELVDSHLDLVFN